MVEKSVPLPQFVEEHIAQAWREYEKAVLANNGGYEEAFGQAVRGVVLAVLLRKEVQVDAIRLPNQEVEEGQGQGQGQVTLPPGRRYGHPRYYALLEEMAEMHERKARDYSGDEAALSNFYAARKLGMTPLQGVLVRMSDKWSRIQSLVLQGGTGMVRGETLADTHMDMAAYNLIAIVLEEESNEQWQK
jgi:hypothetical protein